MPLLCRLTQVFQSFNSHSSEEQQSTLVIIQVSTRSVKRLLWPNLSWLGELNNNSNYTNNSYWDSEKPSEVWEPIFRWSKQSKVKPVSQERIITPTDRFCKSSKNYICRKYRTTWRTIELHCKRIFGRSRHVVFTCQIHEWHFHGVCWT